MDITPQLGEDRQIISRYGAGSFRIGREDYSQTVFLGPDGHVQPLALEEITQLEASQLVPLLQGHQIEILIIGCGLAQQFLPPSLRNALKEHLQIGLEVMDTGAACRTLNVLISEDRRAAALLIPV